MKLLRRTCPQASRAPADAREKLSARLGDKGKRRVSADQRVQRGARSGDVRPRVDRSEGSLVPVQLCDGRAGGRR